MPDADPFSARDADLRRGRLFLWPCSARRRARTLSGSVLWGVRTFLRQIKPARDRLELFGAIMLTLTTPGVKSSTTSAAGTRFD